jgi:hypothetical protein
LSRVLLAVFKLPLSLNGTIMTVDRVAGESHPSTRGQPQNKTRKQICEKEESLVSGILERFFNNHPGLFIP